MNIQEIYNLNKKNFLYSQYSDVENDRNNVLTNFSINKFDKKNNESLKNTDLKKFFDFDYKYNPQENQSITKINKDGSYSIVSVNGKCENYDDEQIQIHKLSELDSKDYFNNELLNTDDFFIDLNSLLLNSGFKIKIKKNKNVKIKISNLISEKNFTVFQRNYILCEEGSSVELIDEYEDKNDAINNVYKILQIEKNANFNHTIVQENSFNHSLILSTHTICKESANYNQHVYNFSEGYVRNFHFSDLKETNSQVDLQGFFFLRNSNTSNNKTFVRHSSDDCKSNQAYKGILNDSSKATYFSNTHVDSVAQKTEGYQLSKGILLSKDAYFFSKPELKIYADDVKCSHGSTIGPIDENAIFYLRSRGISKNAAIKMLVSSFINEELNSIVNDYVFEMIEKKLIRYLSEIK